MVGQRESDEYDDFGDPVGNVAFEMDYAAALERSASSLTTLQTDLLTALVAAPGNELSAGQIARLLGLAHHAGLNSAIVGLAKTLTRAVGVEPPKRANGTPRWWHVVAEGRHGDDRFLWRLRPTLRDAAILAGFGACTDAAFPEESAANPLFEGALKTVRVNAYERNPVARRRCIEHHGTACAVCGQKLSDIYGPIADGVIHVHHLRPLSLCGGVDYLVDPITELRPVCPNCHVVLHLRQPPLTIEELRALRSERR
jgi:predicted HNH restriction endonuclease